MRNLLPRVRSFNKMAAECESSASGSSASTVLLDFEKVCKVKIAVIRRLSFKLFVGFVGRRSHTMEQRVPCAVALEVASNA